MRVWNVERRAVGLSGMEWSHVSQTAVRRLTEDTGRGETVSVCES